MQYEVQHHVHWLKLIFYFEYLNIYSLLSISGHLEANCYSLWLQKPLQSVYSQHKLIFYRLDRVLQRYELQMFVTVNEDITSSSDSIITAKKNLPKH